MDDLFSVVLVFKETAPRSRQFFPILPRPARLPRLLSAALPHTLTAVGIFQFSSRFYCIKPRMLLEQQKL